MNYWIIEENQNFQCISLGYNSWYLSAMFANL